METFRTNMDKMLSAVLLNEKLMEFGKYDESECVSMDVALMSENKVVRTVAQIIKSHNDGNSDSSIYNEVSNYLKRCV